jgi:hypothetical protein
MNIGIVELALILVFLVVVLWVIVQKRRGDG